jgi:hypothetical protein
VSISGGLLVMNFGAGAASCAPLGTSKEAMGRIGSMKSSPKAGCLNASTSPSRHVQGHRRRRTSRNRDRPQQAGLGTGTADLIGYVLGSGRFFALEVKTGSGRVSAEQEAWIGQTNCEGGYAAIARTPEEACEHAWKASKGL